MVTHFSLRHRAPLRPATMPARCVHSVIFCWTCFRPTCHLARACDVTKLGRGASRTMTAEDVPIGDRTLDRGSSTGASRVAPDLRRTWRSAFSRMADRRCRIDFPASSPPDAHSRSSIPGGAARLAHALLLGGQAARPGIRSGAATSLPRSPGALSTGASLNPDRGNHSPASRSSAPHGSANPKSPLHDRPQAAQSPSIGYGSSMRLITLFNRPTLFPPPRVEPGSGAVVAPSFPAGRPTDFAFCALSIVIPQRAECLRKAARGAATREPEGSHRYSLSKIAHAIWNAPCSRGQRPSRTPAHSRVRHRIHEAGVSC